MAGADDVQLGRGLDRLDVDVHLPAADEPGLLREVVRRARSAPAAARGWRSPRAPSRTRRSRSSRRRSCRPSGRRRTRASWRRRAAASSRCVETMVTSAAGSPRSSASATAAKTSRFICSDYTRARAGRTQVDRTCRTAGCAQPPPPADPPLDHRCRSQSFGRLGAGEEASVNDLGQTGVASLPVSRVDVDEADAVRGRRTARWRGRRARAS